MKKKIKREIIETSMTVIGAIGAFAAIPQIIKLYVLCPEHASGVSLLTWVLYAFVCSVWVIYGFVFRRYAIVFCNLLNLVMDIIVVVGVYLEVGLTY